jgi:hypothetical protein
MIKIVTIMIIETKTIKMILVAIINKIIINKLFIYNILQRSR